MDSVLIDCKKQGIPEAATSTLNFSELSETEKAQYFDFIIASDINFQEDKDGKMVVAKVKIRGQAMTDKLNPCDKENMYLSKDHYTNLGIQQVQPRQQAKNNHDRLGVSQQSPFNIDYTSARVTRDGFLFVNH